MFPIKNLKKRVVKEDNKVIDIDTKVQNHYQFTGRILKVAYDIKIDNHHDKNANSQKTITSKVDIMGIDMNHLNKIMEEMSHLYAKLIIQYKFK